MTNECVIGIMKLGMGEVPRIYTIQDNLLPGYPISSRDNASAIRRFSHMLSTGGQCDTACGKAAAQ